ncbi:MAG: T9SS type A sorting domain-containing protein [Bacteroidia bacterium]
MTAKTVVIFFATIICTSIAKTQTAHYTYDDAGNCILRDVIHYHQVPNNDGPDTGMADFREGDLSTAETDAESTNAFSSDHVSSRKGKYAFSIYPNPTQGQLRIVFEDAFLDLPRKQASFYDMQGKLMEQRQINDPNIDFNMSGAAGQYILRIQAEGFKAEWQIIKH